MSWEIISNHIAIRDHATAHLNALDVYKAIKDGGLSIWDHKYESPEEAFPDIFFSSIARYAVVSVFQENNDILLEVTVDGMPVDFVRDVVLDQLIIDKEWFYIANAEEINSLFFGTGIGANGCISLSQYLELLKRDCSCRILSNRVDPKLLCRDLSYLQPKGIVATLYEYQKVGSAWLYSTLNSVNGCILGDEMGLGKTLQAISVLQAFKNRGEKSLVVAPVSLLDNWANEIKKFAPSLKAVIHHGPNRTGNPYTLSSCDVVITSYGNVVTDNLLFSMVTWDLIVIDEAQSIKNPHSKRTKILKTIPAKAKLAISGTPFENHMVDIWSIMDFVLPSFLGSEQFFKQHFSDDIDGAKKLEPILSSVMLRRTVDEVAKDLPEKVIIPQPIAMSPFEAEEYERIRQSLLGQKNFMLPLLQKLRIFCTHPHIADISSTDDPCSASVKYQRTCEILEEVFAKNEKVIIVTSFTSMFDVFTSDLSKRFPGVYIDKIYGDTPVSERQPRVDAFNKHEGIAALIINPRAAGVGLNITGANHVIHYNLEWNPAVEDQATARSYRRGQTKPVFIYRLYYSGTVEEVINERLDRKRNLSMNVVVGVDGKTSDMQDIIAAINISPKGVES